MSLLSSLLRPATVAMRFVAPAAIQRVCARSLSIVCAPFATRLRSLIAGAVQQRWATYGQEYQPSSLRRKRKFGFLARLRTASGRRILARRMRKGRHVIAL